MQDYVIQCIGYEISAYQYYYHHASKYKYQFYACLCFIVIYHLNHTLFFYVLFVRLFLICSASSFALNELDWLKYPWYICRAISAITITPPNSRMYSAAPWPWVSFMMFMQSPPVLL